MNPYIITTKYACVVGSYLGLCTLHWLQVIGFDMWRNLTSLQSIEPKSFEMKRFILYMLYACFAPLFSFFGLAELIVALTSLELWQGFIVVSIVYLCLTLPMIIVFFVLTALKVHRVRQEIKELTKYEEHFRHRNNLKIQKDNFTMYIRLFIAMAVHVCVSNILYIVSHGSMYADIAALFLSLEGVWIFALLVLKRDILHLIKRRLRCLRNLRTKKDSTATNRTNVST
ncbi:G-protein coupled receptor Mth2-like [Sitodiplosis mosellana]|uniref:G-protein coupled receptor Mth2-like n=1 Tax=Sitodiplosis mosellana TaxID=263140 RepID=UPI002443AF7D|nr:G-protein coupled receptor Mth2-like [Sitodiplosis mosellana]